MAILASEKLTLELRFREIDAASQIHYDAWFRYSGKPVVNTDILNRGDPYWQDRIQDGFRAIDEGDDNLIPALREALSTNQPVHWSPIASGFDLFIYPQIYFPPTRKEDFDHPFDFSYILPGIGEARRAYREASGGYLPDDFIWIYARANLINFGEEQYHSGAGLALEMSVFRWELEAFLADLEAEYAELLRSMPAKGSNSLVENWKNPLDRQPHPVQVSFQQGDLQRCIRFSLLVEGQEHPIWASSVSDSFDGLADFLVRVAEGEFPCDCWIDEEGLEKILRGHPCEDPDNFAFELIQPDEPHFKMLMANVFSRRQFVQAVYQGLEAFIQGEFSPQLWGRPYLVRPRLFARLKGVVEA
jgi:hypothetical protein